MPSQAVTHHPTLRPSIAPTNDMLTTLPSLTPSFEVDINSTSTPSSNYPSTSPSAAIELNLQTNSQSLMNNKIVIVILKVTGAILCFLFLWAMGHALWLVYESKRDEKHVEVKNEIDSNSSGMVLNTRGSIDETIAYFGNVRQINYIRGTVCDDLFIKSGKYVSYDVQNRESALNAMNAICDNVHLINPIAYYKLCVHLTDSVMEMRDAAFKALLICTQSHIECVVTESVQLLKNSLFHNFDDSREYATVILGEICKYDPQLITDNVYEILKVFVNDSNNAVAEAVNNTLSLFIMHCHHLSHKVKRQNESDGDCIISPDNKVTHSLVRFVDHIEKMKDPSVAVVEYCISSDSEVSDAGCDQSGSLDQGGDANSGISSHDSSNSDSVMLSVDVDSSIDEEVRSSSSDSSSSSSGDSSSDCLDFSNDLEHASKSIEDMHHIDKKHDDKSESDSYYDSTNSD
jgi:hypothetical protein